MSRQAFDARFSDEEACAQHRRPEGFVCPSCGTCKGWPLKRNRATRECAGCARQTSVTAGTVMHGSHLPLRTWFPAAHIITGHSSGMSALQLQAQPGLGSCKTAWLLLQKLRRAMVITDGRPGRENPPANTHEAKVVSGRPAHDLLHRVHRAFSDLKTWAKGVFHGLGKAPSAKLSRRIRPSGPSPPSFDPPDRMIAARPAPTSAGTDGDTRSAFDTLLGIGVGLESATCRDSVDQRA